MKVNEGNFGCDEGRSKCNQCFTNVDDSSGSNNNDSIPVAVSGPSKFSRLDDNGASTGDRCCNARLRKLCFYYHSASYYLPT